MKRSYYFRGTTKAVSGLAVSRPDDNFPSSTGSKDLQRLPRLGPKMDNSPVFFPGTQLRHMIRESLAVAACESAGGKRPLHEHMMLIQGVAIGPLAEELSSVSTEGVIEREDGLRRKNPVISMGGFWKYPGLLGVNDWIPVHSEQPIYYLHSKMRAMPHLRNPDLVEHLEEPDIAKLKRIVVEDGEIARQARQIETDIKALKKEIVGSAGAAKSSLSTQIKDLEANKSELKKSKEGPTETLVRPVEGYEAIIPNTIMSSGIDISRSTSLDLGMVLYALRRISLSPYVGAHRADGKGEFELDWTVRTWSEGMKKPESLGQVKVGLLDFQIIESEGSSTLSDALAEAEAAFADPEKYGLDFGAFNPVKENGG